MSLKQQLTSLLILSTFCTGCGNAPDEDVVKFVENTKKRESKLQSLPEFKKPKPFFYESKNSRDPFSGRSAMKAVRAAAVPGSNKQPISTYKGPAPDLRRKKEPLEMVNLDSLSMVGVLSRQDKNWALVRDKEGIIHRVGVGNYLGPNYGKVTKITDKDIELHEFLSDGEGGWRQRVSFIKMAGNNN